MNSSAPLSKGDRASEAITRFKTNSAVNNSWAHRVESAPLRKLNLSKHSSKN